jgi:hypothetical protein
MSQSAEVRDSLLRFYELFPAGDLEELVQIIVRKDEGVLVIGTDPAQWTEGREQWITAREAVEHAMEGLRFEAGEEPHGYEEGSMGGSPTGRELCCRTETPSRRAFRAWCAENFKALVFTFPRTSVNRGKGLYKK